jgi:hypothetical protein
MSTTDLANSQRARASRIKTHSIVEIGAAKPSDLSHRFTRGWTLQELIAPQVMKFFDSSLGSALSSITHIPENVLCTQRNLATIPVAQKMSWAADRVTTRIEDTAYCLLLVMPVAKRIYENSY